MIGSNYLFIYESSVWQDGSSNSVVISDMYLKRDMKGIKEEGVQE